MSQGDTGGLTVHVWMAGLNNDYRVFGAACPSVWFIFGSLGGIDTVEQLKSLLRIIIGVLVGIAVFIGMAFVLGLLFRHFHTSFAQVDYVGRYLDNAVYLGLGIAAILIMPLQIKRKLEAGKITEEKARKASRLVWPLGCLCIGIGILRIVGFLP